MSLRVRNIWFDGLSFLVAMLMVGCAVSSLVMHTRDKNASFIGTGIAAGTFLLLAIIYFWMSLRAGGIQRRARETRRKQDGHHSGAATTNGAEQSPR
jgi:hypothetical protein